MLKIVRDNCIWATSINYLNDTTEGDHYVGLIRARVDGYMRSHAVTDPRIFDRIKEDQKQIGFDVRPFVTSFSALPDFLPQWRSYCPQGNGVAIGFRTECLQQAEVIDSVLNQESHPDRARHKFFLPRVRFAGVGYLDEAAEEVLDQDIGAAITEARVWQSARHELAGSAGYQADSLFEKTIQRNAGFIKNPSFSNEGEYRLLVDSTHWNRKLFGFRPTRSTLVPYLPVRIPRLYEGVPFIDHVVIGPTPNEELSRQAVLVFLYNEGLDKVHVTLSKIPYREW